MTNPKRNPPAGGADGLGNTSLLGSIDGSKTTKSSYIAQAKIEMICEEIGWVVSPMISTLEAALAMREAGNIPGFVYGLRCAGAYWRNIAANAKDLVALHQEGASQ
jgi:hypothetical protein